MEKGKITLGKRVDAMKAVTANKKGYTLVELIIVVAIFAMVFAPIGTIFVNDMRVFNQTTDKNMTQTEAQKAVNIIFDEAVNASSVSAVSLEGTSLLSETAQSLVDSITFKEPNMPGYSRIRITDSDGDGVNELWLDKLDNGMNLLEDGSSRLAECIESLSVEPLEGSFSTCKSIRVVITSRRGNSTTAADTQMYFRNH